MPVMWCSPVSTMSGVIAGIGPLTGILRPCRHPFHLSRASYVGTLKASDVPRPRRTGRVAPAVSRRLPERPLDKGDVVEAERPQVRYILLNWSIAY